MNNKRGPLEVKSISAGLTNTMDMNLFQSFLH